MTATILYEVVIKLAPDIRDDYIAWLHPHMAEMLTFDGFQSADMFVNSENPNEITCHYRLRDREAMDAYLAGPAQRMRADGIARFGEKMQAVRRILIFNKGNAQ